METKYAGFWRRFAAASIDGILLGPLIAVAVETTMSKELQLFYHQYGALVLGYPLLFSFSIFVNGLLDAMLVFAPYSLIVAILAWNGMVNWEQATGVRGIALFTFETVITMMIINWLYHALLESSVKQATLGKMVLKIKVTDLNGQRISFWRATARHFSKSLSTLTLLIGFLVAEYTAKRQALHDKITGYLVVKIPGVL